MLGGMNKHSPHLKANATRLRKQGLSYSEIQKRVPVSKSTLSLWLKSVPLKPEHRKRLYTKQIQILSRGPQSQKERRAREVEHIIKEAAKEITLPLSNNAYKLFGAALYWAEGTKRKNFEIANSDPYLISFMVGWFKKVFGVPPRTLKAHLNMYPQQNEKALKQFWSELTGIPTANFGKSYTKPKSSGYKKNNLYYGTIKVYVPKGTDMRHKIFGWVQSVLQTITPEVEYTRQKWSSIAATKRPVNLR
jgi:hypothetical protein